MLGQMHSKRESLLGTAESFAGGLGQSSEGLRRERFQRRELFQRRWEGRGWGRGSIPVHGIMLAEYSSRHLAN